VIGGGPLDAATLVELLQRRAVLHPHRVFIRHLERGEAVTSVVTFADLHARASAIARRLRQQFAPGDRALLLYPNDPDYVAAFFACLYAGLIAVPAYPPQSSRPQHLQRLRSIADSAQPSAVLCTRAIAELLNVADVHGVDLGEIVITDDARPTGVEFVPAVADPGSVAFLQYTSGSTSAPKGVRVTHANLIANSRAIREVFACSAEDVFVSWLPLFHDMGLIGLLLQPLYSGAELILFSPQRFLESPLRWLRAISAHGGTISGGPDFAYRLCADRIDADRLGELDLSRWRLAFSGSEPVRRESFDAFARLVEPCRFSAKSLYPCYGLAEATLLVSGGTPGSGARAIELDAEQLALGVAREQSGGRAIVECGRPASEHELRISDPETRAACAADRVGEIWVAGPSVADGYWNDRAATERAFVHADGRAWLRTGDLGFLLGGALFVSGRLKDLLIVRGRNLYPQDLERAVETAVEVLPRGRVAAFPVEHAGAETIGIAAEVSRRLRALIEPTALARAIVEAVAEQASEPPGLILLLNPGTLPMTSSGKLRRSACVEAWQSGRLVPFWTQQLGDPPNEQPARTPAAAGAAGAAIADDSARSAVEAELSAILCSLLGVERVAPDASFFALGASSLALVQLRSRICERFGVELEFASLYERSSLRALAAHVADAVGQPQARARAALIPVARSRRLPLSRAEEGMWIQQQLDPTSAAYTLAVDVRLDGPLDSAALERALSQLVARHEVLRSTYGSDDAGGYRVIHAPSQLPIAWLVVSALRATDRAARIRQAVQAAASAPFDLVAGPLLRVALVRCAPEEHRLLVTAHHIVADGASLDVLLEELLALYGAEVQHSDAPLGPIALQYADYAAAARSRESEHARHAAELAYFRAKLGSEHPLLALPVDRPRSERRGHQAGQHAVRLGSELASAVRAFACQSETTVFTVLLAAFYASLQRVTGDEELRIGIASANRGRRELERMVGFFVNTLVSSLRVSPRESFSALLARVKRETIETQAHGALPFAELVAALAPERSRSHAALLQVMFNHLEPSVRPGTVAAGGLTLSELARPAFQTELDLALDTTEHADDIAAVFTFSSELFEPTTIARLADQLSTLLRAALARPEAAIAELPLLDRAQRAQRVAAGEGVRQERPAHACLHRAFEQQASATPHATALRCGERSLSYSELDQSAERLAAHLRALGSVREELVGLCCERSIEAVIGMLAVLKAGGAYLPIDPALPVARARAVLQAAGTVRVLVDARGAALLAEQAEPPTNENPPLALFGALAATPLPLALVPLALHEEASMLGATPWQDATASSVAYCLFTSGSTGVPKGVLIAHGGVLSHATWMRSALGAGIEQRVLQYAPLGFDASVCEVWLPLLHGGTCVIARAEASDPDSFLAEVAEVRPTLLQGVPSLLGAWLEHPSGAAVLGALPCLVSGGEALPVALWRKLEASGATRVFNLYGPTETTIDATFHHCGAGRSGASVPIGRPIGNASAHVLDAYLEPVPLGVVGELYVGGHGVARGYLNAPALTAERFVPDPFAAPGARLYRTGDLVRARSDGELEFVGRADGQVKHNGNRIELGEVEAVVRAHAAVRAAHAVLVPAMGGLFAYVVLDPACAAAAALEALGETCAQRLPSYVRPRAFIALPSLPLLASGKVDVRALPPPSPDAGAAPQVAPRDDLERELAAIWAQVLQLDSPSVHANFFALGGDSIAAIRIAGRAREAGLVLAPKDLFEHPTLAALARATQRAAQSLPTQHVAQDAAPAPLLALSDEQLAQLPFPRAELEDAFALSPMQQGMLLHTLLEPGSGIYVMQDVYRIDSALDAQQFVRACQRVIAHHASLRVSFWQREDEVLQLVHRELPSAVEYHDYRGYSGLEQHARLELLLEDERRAGFDLSRPPLIKLRLIQLDDARYLYVESHHHILMDDWCRSLLLMDFFAEYRAGCEGRVRQAPRTTPYRAFIDWLARQDPAQALAFFRERLASFDSVTPLGVERPAALAGGSRIGQRALLLSAEHSAGLANAGKQLQVTLNTLAQGAWAALLAQYAGTSDVLFGVTVAGRPPELLGSDDIVGIFVNTIPLRVRVPTAGDTTTVAAWLRSLQRENLALRQHEHVPLTEIQTCSGVPQGQALFRSLFVFENAPIDPALFDRALELEVELESNRTHTNYPITVVVVPGARVKLMLSYDERLFDAADIERMLAQFERLLSALAAEPQAPVARLPRLTAQEHASLLVDLNRSRVEHPLDLGYDALFARSAARHGERNAVRCGEASASYRLLDERAEALAATLRAGGAGAGSLVAVVAERSIDWLVAILAVLRSGSGFMPVDLNLPRARMAELIARARVAIAVADAAGAAMLQGVPAGAGQARLTVLACDPEPEIPPRVRERAPERPVPRDQLAYVIHTSGSTGVPKAAMVTSAGMLNNQLSKIPLLGLSERDVIAQTAAPSFDIFIWQLLAGLLCGASIEIVPDHVSRDPARLLAHVQQAGVTVLQSVPALIASMLESEPVALPALRFMLLTGEALGAALARRWFEVYPQVPLVNAFGPAECADDVALHVLREPPLTDDDRVPIGRPADNTSLYVLDRQLAPVPPGVVGELYVGGIGVGRGYLHDAVQTASRFVPDPFSSELGLRLYRSGDLVRHRGDGTLEFIGRADQQVKVQGQRIELGEIEARLLELDAVKEAAVVAHEDANGWKQLVAFVVPAETAAAPIERELAERIEAALGASLPVYMVPRRYAFLERLPLTANGKLDRRALPIPAPQSRQPVAPENALEAGLLASFAHVLGVQEMGVTDDFFELGGHSLLFTRVAARVRSELQLEIPLRMLFDHPSVRVLARELTRSGAQLAVQREIAVMAELLNELEQQP